jgi:hypothetical protein
MLRGGVRACIKIRCQLKHRTFVVSKENKQEHVANGLECLLSDADTTQSHHNVTQYSGNTWMV